MAYRRVAGAALLQGLLFACGVGLAAALRAGFTATAVTLGLAALWIAAATAWQARLRTGRAIAASPARPERDAVRTRLLASLLDQTPAPLVTRDAQGALAARNRAARQLFRTDGPILDPPPPLLAALEQGGGQGRQVVRIGAGVVEPARTYAVSLSDVVAEDGPLRLAVLLDIEPDLRAAEAAALRELMQVLSHEIMNGLTPVASLAHTALELLAADGAEARRQTGEALEVLARRADGLARFAEGYRTLARLPPPVRAPTSVAALVDEAAQLFRSRWGERGVFLATAGPVGDVQVELDRDQVIHALSNLTSNAAQAALAAGATPRVELSWAAQADGVVLGVEDSGPGVADSVREHIGKPFFTTKPDGTGVGLSLATQIARAHGGALQVRRSPGLGGARFELHLRGALAPDGSTRVAGARAPPARSPP